MALNVYMNFPGNASEVIHYYKEVFNTPEPQVMLFKDMPPSEDFPVTPEMESMVMHGLIQINESQIMFSDVPPGSPMSVTFGNNMSMIYSSKDYDDLKALFDKMASDGTVTMPFEKTFWSKGYGMLIDKFGIGWQFNCDEE